MQTIAFRLKPGTDLRTGIEEALKEQNITSAFVLTCVGSLNKVTVRMAGAQPSKQDVKTYQGHFEVVSLVGTVSPDGEHLHISFSDEQGVVLGGHLKKGTIIGTTAEVVLGVGDQTFSRRLDDTTGFKELVVE